MPALYPPEYPYRPDAPLLSFGPSFSEEIALSVLRATNDGNDEEPHETEIRSSATLTMLEGFHPRDHVECMLAAQGVAMHCAEMDSLAQAMRSGQSDAMVMKWRANAALMSRSFLATSRELDRRQSKLLPPRPRNLSAPPPASPPDPPPSGPADGATPRRPRASAAAAPPPAAPQQPLPDLDDLPEIPEDIETRPDGTPGSLTAYAPKQPVQVNIPRIAPIMAALSTLPPPYRLVDNPASQIDPATGWPRSLRDENPAFGAGFPPIASPSPDAPAANLDLTARRGPLGVTERLSGDDALSRFASARFDPDAPIPTPPFEDEELVVELELISTGGDPELEARRAALIAAHPEGRPIATYQYGTRPPANGPDPPPKPRDKPPPDSSDPG